MRENQQSMGAWAKSTFPGGDDLSPRHCLRLLEEVVELCLAAGARFGEVSAATAGVVFRAAYRIDPKQAMERGVASFHDAHPEPGVVPEELADCAIVLAVLAERRGVDLAGAVDAKMAVNRARKWEARGDGTGYHVPEE